MSQFLVRGNLQCVLLCCIIATLSVIFPIFEDIKDFLNWVPVHYQCTQTLLHLLRLIWPVKHCRYTYQWDVLLLLLVMIALTMAVEFCCCAVIHSVLNSLDVKKAIGPDGVKLLHFERLCKWMVLPSVFTIYQWVCKAGSFQCLGRLLVSLLSINAWILLLTHDFIAWLLFFLHCLYLKKLFIHNCIDTFPLTFSVWMPTRPLTIESLL